jgi:folate-dependent tRNA-U54 methylase TrmFO/GidA
MLDINTCDTKEFQKSVNLFAQSVVLMGTLIGMKAENDQRVHLGQSLAYDEKSFIDEIKDWMKTLEEKS